MKARELQAYLETTRAAHETKKKICVASGMCHDLISVDKKTLKIKYALDTFNKGRNCLVDRDEELLNIYDKLQELIDTGKIKYYIEGKDKLEKRLPVFSCDNGVLIEDYTDKYGYPNVTESGVLMYENSHFSTKEEAIKSGLVDMSLWIKFSRQSIAQKQDEIHKKLTMIKEAKQKIKNLKREVVGAVKKGITDNF